MDTRGWLIYKGLARIIARIIRKRFVQLKGLRAAFKKFRSRYHELAIFYVNTSTYESACLPYDEFPRTEEPVHLLGEMYSALHDREELKQDFLSRIWLTYRRNFAAIGGTGPSGDTGWGCMLRCGQMMLAHALLLRHCGRGWRWKENCQDENYWKILRMFQDKKSAYFSIHQIASMGVSEGKAVGQWFGPNTVAQVLKKLVIYDKWSSLVIHVAMDNTVIEHDIRCLCSGIDSKDIVSNHTEGADIGHAAGRSCSQDKKKQSTTSQPDKWKPLLLIIPLRLGLTDINAVYIDGLKKCLGFKHSIGIIGGKPNHAHWFVGYVGDKLIYLDPHTTQFTVDLDESTAGDESYHCPYPSLMNIMELDPSIAVGFYCATEGDFNDLCAMIQRYVIEACKTPMFELYKERPLHWPTYEPYKVQEPNTHGASFTMVDGSQSDEEFELIG